jgi:chromate transporter
VLAIVLEAVRRIGRRALRNTILRGIAAAAFVAIFFLAVPFPLIVLAAGVIGYAGARAGSAAFAPGGGHGASGEAGLADADSALGAHVPDHARPNLRWSLSISAVFLLLWLAPVALIVAVLGPDNVFSAIGLFFAKMAVVTFGGAYAVLAYVAQQAVGHYGWLAPGEMLDGLGMAETTPGPLIMVTQFVGFMGAFRRAGGLDPFVAGTLGGLLTTWVTFTPCFLWIFLGAPFIERLRGNTALSGALAAITAAVVGVVLNLALWFALHTLFGTLHAVIAGPLRLDVPKWASVNLPACALTLAALVAMLRFKAGALPVLAACGAAGLAWRLAFA